ncbi:MAG: hypothetical protein E6R04_07250 [Spirochaetes bacterium]|nr:MAG: hypothetical protein E6R04_07250 [Spirochaetota bacterium]
MRKIAKSEYKRRARKAWETTQKTYSRREISSMKSSAAYKAWQTKRIKKAVAEAVAKVTGR